MKKITTRKLLIATLLVSSAALVSAMAGDAKETWEKTCAKCHGPDGKGETKIGKMLQIKDFTDAKSQASFKDEEMAKAIKEGVKEGEKTKMKPLEGASDDEIKALVAYVRGLKK